MAKTTQPAQLNKPTDNLDERLGNLPVVTTSTEEGASSTTVTELEAKVKELEEKLIGTLNDLGDVRAENNDLKLKVAELEEDKEALNGQIDELEKLGTSRSSSLRVKQASDADKLSDMELKDNRINIPGIGTVERADITEAHVKALCELCNKEVGADPETTINKYFQLKKKEAQ